MSLREPSSKFMVAAMISEYDCDISPQPRFANISLTLQPFHLGLDQIHGSKGRPFDNVSGYCPLHREQG